MNLRGMLRIVKFTLLLTLIIGCGNSIQNQNDDGSNRSQQGDIKEKQKIETIREFYLTCYGSDAVPNDKLLPKYISERLLKRMDSLRSEEELILDYDPFINGQDFDSEALKKTIKIDKLKDENEYRVSFLLFDFPNEERTHIDLLLEESNGSFLISAILNDELLNFKGKENASDVSSSSGNSINGTWRVNCDDGSGSLKIADDKVFLEVNSNQIYIDARIKKQNDDTYLLYLKSPRDLGAGGMRLNWDHFSEDSLLAKLRYSNNANSLKFNWHGFYDTMEKKRVWQNDSDFQISSDQLKDITLIKCD